MTFEQWYESEFRKPPDFNGRYFRSAWEAGRSQAIIEAAEVAQRKTDEMLCHDHVLVDAIKSAIRSL